MRRLPEREAVPAQWGGGPRTGPGWALEPEQVRRAPLKGNNDLEVVDWIHTGGLTK